MPNFSIRVSPAGRLEWLSINGQEIRQHVRQVAVYAGDGEVPRIQLEFVDAFDITGEGIVEVMKGSAISELNPKEVEGRALERMGFDGDTDNLVVAVMKTIQEMVS